MILHSTGMIIPSVAGVYYMTYYVRRPDLIPLYMVIAMGTGLIVTPFIPAILKRISGKALTVISAAGMALFNIIVYFVPPTSIPVLFILFALVAVFTMVPIITITSLLAHTADYVSVKENKRYDGVIFSLNSFAVKVGTAFAGVIMSLILGLTGYIANLPEQTSGVMTGINLSRSFIPAAIAVIAMLLAMTYKSPEKSN